MKFKTLLSIFLLFILGGCSVSGNLIITNAPPSVATGNAELVLILPHTNHGNWTAPPMYLHGKQVGKMEIHMTAGSYSAYALEPGNYMLKLGKGPSKKRYSPNKYKLAVKEGQTTYLLIEPAVQGRKSKRHQSLTFRELPEKKAKGEMKKWKKAKRRGSPKAKKAQKVY